MLRYRITAYYFEIFFIVINYLSSRHKCTYKSTCVSTRGIVHIYIIAFIIFNYVYVNRLEKFLIMRNEMLV